MAVSRHFQGCDRRARQVGRGGAGRGHRRARVRVWSGGGACAGQAHARTLEVARWEDAPGTAPRRALTPPTAEGVPGAPQRRLCGLPSSTLTATAALAEGPTRASACTSALTVFSHQMTFSTTQQMRKMLSSDQAMLARKAAWR